MSKALGALVGLALVFAGCGSAGTGATSAVALGATAASIPDSLKSQTLIYVTVGKDVSVFAYPSGKLVQNLPFPNELGDICSDSNGNVWITEPSKYSYRSGYLTEFAHGGTSPIATLDDAHSPVACAVDPSTGDLAAVNDQGSIAVYPDAQGTPTYYSSGNVYPCCSVCYDNSSDLFFTGYVESALGVGWLQKGQSTLNSFRLRPNERPKSGLAWDGQYLVDAVNPVYMYKYAIIGTHGKKVGKLSLDIHKMAGFAIRGSLLVATDDYTGAVDYFHYPSGKPIRVVSGIRGYGITISIPPSH